MKEKLLKQIRNVPRNVGCVCFNLESAYSYATMITVLVVFNVFFDKYQSYSKSYYTALPPLYSVWIKALLVQIICLL